MRCILFSFWTITAVIDLLLPFYKLLFEYTVILSTIYLYAFKTCFYALWIQRGFGCMNEEDWRFYYDKAVEFILIKPWKEIRTIKEDTILNMKKIPWKNVHIMKEDSNHERIHKPWKKIQTVNRYKPWKSVQIFVIEEVILLLYYITFYVHWFVWNMLFVVKISMNIHKDMFCLLKIKLEDENCKQTYRHDYVHKLQT